MDVSKIICRKLLNWQCIHQVKKRLHSGVISALSNGTIAGTNVPSQRLRLQIFTPSSLSSSRVWSKYSTDNRSVRWYSLEASSSTDKQEQSTSPTTKESTSEKSAVEEASSQSPKESSESDALSVSSPETEETISTSEQDVSDWENSKLDKLYKVIELEVLAYEPSVLDSYQWFVVSAATHLGIQIGKCWSPLKPEKMRFNLLKSAFVHKKHQVQYEVRTHHRFLTFHKLTSSTADTFLEYIERNLPEGVGLKVTRVEAKALPDYLQKQAQN